MEEPDPNSHRLHWVEAYEFLFPEPIVDRLGVGGFVMPIGTLFDRLASFEKDRDPEFAAILLEAATHLPRDDGAVLKLPARTNEEPENRDEIEDLSAEEVANRRNRATAIAMVDRLRFVLEMTTDLPRDAERINEIRRHLAALDDLDPFASMRALAAELEAKSGD